MKQTRVCTECNQLHTVELTQYEIDLGIVFKKKCNSCTQRTLELLQLAYMPSTTIN